MFRLQLSRRKTHTIRLPALIDTGADVTSIPGWHLGVFAAPGGGVQTDGESPLKGAQLTTRPLYIADGREVDAMFLRTRVTVRTEGGGPALPRRELDVRILPTDRDGERPNYALLGQDILRGLWLLHARPANLLQLATDPIPLPSWMKRIAAALRSE